MSLLTALTGGDGLGPLHLHFARTVGRLGGVDDPEVLAAAALACWAPDRGHACVRLEEVGKLLAETELAGTELPEPAAWRARVAAARALVRTREEDRRTPLVLHGDALYLERYWDHERTLADRLRARAASEPPSVDEAEVDRLVGRLFQDVPETAGQRRALRSMLCRPLTVLTGGPGTGKTSVVVKLLAALNHLAERDGRPLPRVGLVAPTGKAAARLEESVRTTLDDPSWIPPELRSDLTISASTIHRALRWASPTRFRHGADNPLPVDVLVVDEASMIDLPLMRRLVEAVPQQARLILMGDPNQLASVEAGAVLADLGAAGLAGCHVHLEHTWRFGGALLALARAIERQDAEAVLDLLDDPAHPEVGRVEAPDDPTLDRLLDRFAVEPYREAALADSPNAALAALDRFRLLCAHRSGRLAVSHLGERVERRLAALGVIQPDEPWYPGRPVMIRRNDPVLGLSNGEVGIVRADGDERLAWFPGEDGARAFSPGALPAHETVWATTVHKAQGAEYDRVLVVLPHTLSPLVGRELLYTAVTRARREVFVLGDREHIRSAVQRPLRRMTGLQALLRGGGSARGR